VRRGDRHSRSSALGASLLAGSLLLLLSGCGLLSGPKPLSEDAPQIIQVTSPDVSKGVLDSAYTCHGSKPMSPSISWSGAPSRATKSYALVVDDSNAPIAPWVYWLVFDIGSATTYIQPGSTPPGARVAYNSMGQAGYQPPCPRGGPHKYRITVYALNMSLANLLPSRPQLLPTWTTIAPHVIARGTLSVTACPATACRAESSK
jgi:Raf kinase inhibitor-like YbhB/YbcL family protein